MLCSQKEEIMLAMLNSFLPIIRPHWLKFEMGSVGLVDRTCAVLTHIVLAAPTAMNVALNHFKHKHGLSQLHR